MTQEIKLSVQWMTDGKNNLTTMIADFDGCRLLVRRSEPRSRSFVGKINGHMVGIWPSMEMAKSQTFALLHEKGAKAFRVAP